MGHWKLEGTKTHRKCTKGHGQDAETFSKENTNNDHKLAMVKSLYFEILIMLALENLG